MCRRLPHVCALMLCQQSGAFSVCTTNYCGLPPVTAPHRPGLSNLGLQPRIHYLCFLWPPPPHHQHYLHYSRMPHDEEILSLESCEIVLYASHFLSESVFLSLRHNRRLTESEHRRSRTSFHYLPTRSGVSAMFTHKEITNVLSFLHHKVTLLQVAALIPLRTCPAHSRLA